ncbi:MAG: hypothetical protein IJS46_02600 [Kiritimatiellae bacterium]|nr:hypothetical protein [Kiritimatiellia bacterium]
MGFFKHAAAGRVRKAAAEAGFSLVAVALALTVAAGGMISIFGLFPAGLRQGMNSNRDIVGASFAGSVLAAISGNVRQIDDIRVWNNPEQWWKCAVADTGLEDNWNSGKKPNDFLKDTSVFTPNRSKVAEKNANVSRDENVVRFFAYDRGTRVTTGNVTKPPHYIIRVVRVRRKPRPVAWDDVRGYVSAVERYETMTESAAENAIGKKSSSGRVAAGDMRSPDRYIVSIVSSDQKGYAIFVNEPVYSQEFFFLPRP